MPEDRKPPAPGTRPRKVQADERGRSVWVDTIETAEFELVSTQALKVLLDEEHVGERREIERIAARSDEGYLARDAATGHFQVIDDDALQAILDQQPGSASPARRAAETTAPSSQEPGIDTNEWQLVSTQALRKILGEPEPEKSGTKSGEDFSRDDAGGFNPYNTG